MELYNRIKEIHNMCIELCNTTSRLDKEYIVKKYRDMDALLSEDITYVFEILSGQHKLGYTFIKIEGSMFVYDANTYSHLKDYLEPLYKIKDKKTETIYEVCSMYSITAKYLEKILNREWKIGINKSQLDKKLISPMLAKKYEPSKHCKNKYESYYITEKLDGNRCISYYDYDLNKWIFNSRSGKMLKVDFDMKNIPTCCVYDGEILSVDQLINPGQRNFNSLSGKINSIYGDKSGLVYVIFDMIDDVSTYRERRMALNSISNARAGVESNTMILPLINCLNADQMSQLDELLKMIEDKGGEGLMINLGSRKYEHKRTDALLKVKSTYTMDMKVYDIEEGTGKYEGLVGALLCTASDGINTYECKVGSGLSDIQREVWAYDESKIVGKIVEVAYFSTSQSKTSSNTHTYSLRFPRFKRIRDDKTDTSVD